jgi:hypothetical protein
MAPKSVAEQMALARRTAKAWACARDAASGVGLAQ